MNSLKKYLGLLWMIIGPLAIALLIYGAFDNVHPPYKEDINKPLPWVIIITIFTPIAIGLTIFGWYSWNDEFGISNREQGTRNVEGR
jgi:hypothetical protein